SPSAGSGNNGDMYINSTTGDVYGPKALGAWGGIMTNIMGGAGAMGVTGATGPSGYSPEFIVGAGIPPAGSGNNGDIYINSTTGDVYGPKTSGVWGGVVANIQGAPGATGPAGTAGYTPTFIVAAGAPSADTGNNSDMYVNSAAGDVYGPKTAGG